MADEKEFLITQEGLNALKEELEHLTRIKRREIAARIKEALAYGDLSENSEYQDAKNEQAFVEGKIIDLEQKIKNAKIFEERSTSGRASKGAMVQLGSAVTIRQVGTRADEQYAVVGSVEADPLNGKISNESPLGAALLNHHLGDRVKVDTPTGRTEYQIVSVR